MKIISVQDLVGTEREVFCPNGGFISRRLLLHKDNMGYSLHHTTVAPGQPQRWHYTNHLEACYCVSGRGMLTELSSGKCHMISPGTVYALDRHDDHTFEAFEETVLICVFNPPITGKEVHDENGSYPVSSD